jgi:REP element-mobilizing transposase RayT
MGEDRKFEHTGIADFEPVNPWRSRERGEHRRQLPHLQTPQSTYFVTFRCRDGLSLPDEAKAIVMSAVRYWDGTRIDVDAAVVMPDHAHIMMRVLEDRSLSAILQSIKGFSSLTVNQLLGRKGALARRELRSHHPPRIGVAREDGLHSR